MQWQTWKASSAGDCFTLRYGTRLHITGEVLHCLRRRDIPLWVGADCVARVHDTVAVASQDGALVTIHRNPKILHRLKKRPRRDARRGLGPLSRPGW